MYSACSKLCIYSITQKIIINGCYVREHIPLQPEMTCDPAVVSVTPPVVPSFSHRPGVWITCKKKSPQKSVMLMSEIHVEAAKNNKGAL